MWCGAGRAGATPTLLPVDLRAPAEANQEARTRGGRFAQLRRLRSGMRPVTRELLPPAIDEEGKCMLYNRTVGVIELQLQAKRGGKLATASLAYPTATASSYTSGTPAAEKMRLRLERVRANEKEAKKVGAGGLAGLVPRRLRGKQRVAAANAEVRCEPCGGMVDCRV